MTNDYTDGLQPTNHVGVTLKHATLNQMTCQTDVLKYNYNFNQDSSTPHSLFNQVPLLLPD